MRGAPPLRCAVGYATALHDITHIVLSYSRDDDRVAGRSLSKFAGMQYSFHKPMAASCEETFSHIGSCDRKLAPKGRGGGLAATFSLVQIVQCRSNTYRGRLVMLDEYFASSSTLQRNERVKLAAMFWNIVGAGMLIGGETGAFFFEGPLFWGKVGIAVVGIVLALIFQRIGDRMLGYLRAP